MSMSGHATCDLRQVASLLKRANERRGDLQGPSTEFQQLLWCSREGDASEPIVQLLSSSMLTPLATESVRF